MTSEELRKAGYKANNGLRDQRTAMQWIRQFIGGFGGDPEEITACGESAGGCMYLHRIWAGWRLTAIVSVTMFLCSKEPLMKRCFSTGGAVLLFKPIPELVAESSYQKIIEAFGLKDMSPEDRIEALLSIPADDLWQKIPQGTPLIASLDGDTIPGSPDFLSVSSKEDSSTFMMPGRKWCKAFMAGESKLDVRSEPPPYSPNTN
jgi:carboxylesterase type B